MTGNPWLPVTVGNETWKSGLEVCGGCGSVAELDL